MKPIKIVFFIYRMGGGGAARTMLNIINHLDREKFEPVLVTLDFTYDYEENVKNDVKFIKLPTKRLRQSIVPLSKLIKELKPDILFSTVSTYNVIAILAKLLSRTPTKLVIREAALLGQTRKERAKLKVIGLTYKCADKIISLSEGVKRNLIERYDAAENKIQVIYNPVDIDDIEKQMTENISLPTAANHKTIITAGRLVKEKDQATLIKAFNIVQKNLPIELIILGEGAEEAELKALTAELGLTEKIHFLGFQKNPYAYFKQADLFALSSISEGFGHVFVEALTTGTPIVSTRCNPGAREVLQNGRYGKIAEVGDVVGLATQMQEVLQRTDQEKAAAQAKGKAYVKQYAVDEIVKEYGRMFQKVAKTVKK